jgi:3-dehydroquinate dehydratase
MNNTVAATPIPKQTESPLKISIIENETAQNVITAPIIKIVVKTAVVMVLVPLVNVYLTNISNREENLNPWEYK